jgi:hypothetical protein
MPHSTGRGGTGNFKVGPDETSTERTHRLSVTAQDADYTGSGRGGAGNITNKEMVQKKLEVQKGLEEQRAVEKAKASATAAAEAIQYPKPTRWQ